MRIRDLRKDDLDAIFEMQRNPESRWMAAFSSKDPDDRQAFLSHMSKIAADNEVIYKVVESENQVAGIVGKWVSESGPELMYWIDARFKGMGLATSAVKEFLLLFTGRPIYAHTAGDNLASQAVLRNSGFSKYEEIQSFSDIRNAEMLEIGFILN